MNHPATTPTNLAPRALAAGAALALLLSLPLAAAVTGSGTLSPDDPRLEYTSGPFLVSNPSAQVNSLATGDELPLCDDTAAPCDDFTLSVDIPAGYQAAHPTDRIAIAIEWPTSADDFDMYVLDENGAMVDRSASSGKPEIVVLPATDGQRTYTVRVAPFLVTGDSYTGTITLGPAPTYTYNPSAAPAPGFAVYPVPDNLGENFGETSIGFDPVHRVLMFTGRRYLNVAGKTMRIGFDDSVSPARPTWADVTPLSSQATTLDPIGYTDRTTGRTLVSQLHGACSLTDFTDDAGSLWVPSEGCGLATLVDHQTLGGGPFAPPLAGGTPVYPNAVYYCAQADVEASCAVSLDGGLTFGAGVPAYTTECGGLHGHIKVAPDGTAYLPNARCSPNQAVVVSQDNGQSWQVRRVPNSLLGDTDPSVGIASDGTVYFGYINGDGHPHVAVSHDRGLNWVNDTDIGASWGIANGVFPAVVAGDPDRAVFAFHGTDAPGNFEAIDFPGVWYLYVAATYDGGRSWVTSRVTPGDPVQGPGGICASGIACNADPDNRNLLDFFDATMDDGGRAVIGYSDGCLGCDLDATPDDADFASYGTVARQSSGLRLLAAFDPPPPLEDVTSRIQLVQSGLTYKSGISSFKLKLKNISNAGIAAPLDVMVAAIQSGANDVTVANADNGETGPGATFDFSDQLNGDSQLAPNEVSTARTLSFSTPGKEKFTVTLKVLQGNMSSSTVAASSSSSSATEVRYVRLSVDPLLGTISIVQILG